MIPAGGPAAPAGGDCLFAPIARFAATAPRRPAIVTPHATIDMARFHDRALAAAAWLAGRGCGPGMAVGLSYPGNPDHLVLLHALGRLGAIVLPLDRTAPSAERQALARRVGARLVVGAAATDALPGLPLVAADPAAWTAEGPLPPLPTADAPWLFSLSAGSTGQPKAMLYTHRHEILRITRLGGLLGAGPDDRYLVVVDVGFNLGRVAALRMLHHGGTVVFPEALPDTRALAEATRRHGITWMVLTPAMVEQMLAAWPGPAPLLDHVRCIIVSGARLPPETLRAARARLGRGIHVLYGTNEVGPISILRPDDGAPDDSVGRLVPGIEALVTDDRSVPLAAGAVGEIRFRGDCIPPGYHADAEADRRHFRGAWFVPGDLATIDAAGFVRLRGRTDDVINVDGRKVYPVEIEEALRSHDAVLAAAAVGLPIGGVTVPAAAVVLRRPVRPSELRRHCAARLAPYKLPRRIVGLPAIPTNELGKLDRPRLLAALAPTGAVPTPAMPRT
ncbi:class I adenylate-forming enzyme family protein [Stella sp.]|uniref:class I adenylate-forming enzyme family protein n=1 Tax=Stella sp. TaxID=2912054 RepID=UPI0035AE1957